MHYIMLVPVTQAEADELSGKTGTDVVVVTIAGVGLVALPLGKDESAGQLSKTFYDPATRRWTATIATRRFL